MANKRQTSARLTLSSLEAVKQMAEIEGVSQSAIVERAVRMFKRLEFKELCTEQELARNQAVVPAGRRRVKEDVEEEEDDGDEGEDVDREDGEAGVEDPVQPRTASQVNLAGKEAVRLHKTPRTSRGRGHGRGHPIGKEWKPEGKPVLYVSHVYTTLRDTKGPTQPGYVVTGSCKHFTFFPVGGEFDPDNIQETYMCGVCSRLERAGSE